MPPSVTKQPRHDNFLPAHLRRRLDIELSPHARGRFHDFARQAVEAMQRGDALLAFYFAGLAARAVEGGAG